MSTKLCPKCGSGKTRDLNSETVGLEMDPEVQCTSCGWYGKYKELMAPLQTKPLEGLDPGLRVAEEVANAYMKELAKSVGHPIGLAMVTTGIIGVKEEPSHFARLIRAALQAAHRATLEEIEKIQKELRDGPGN